jgi:hypothetical protein
MTRHLLSQRVQRVAIWRKPIFSGVHLRRWRAIVLWELRYAAKAIFLIAVLMLMYRAVFFTVKAAVHKPMHYAVHRLLD